MRAHVIVAAGAAEVVVEGHAGTDHIDDGSAVVAHGALDKRHQLGLVARKAARHKGGAHLQRQIGQFHRAVGIDGAALAGAALVGCGGKLPLGQAVDAVVLHDISHVDIAAHAVDELAQADGSRIAVTRDAEVQQIAVGQAGACEDAGHASVHAVEPVRGAQKVVGRFGAAADTRELGYAMRLDVELPAGLDDGGGNGVVPATRAQRGDLAFVVAARVADLVFWERGMVQTGFGDKGHAASGGASAAVWWACRAMASMMKRAVMGVPS